MKMFEHDKDNEAMYALAKDKYVAIGEQVSPPLKETFDNPMDWFVHLMAGQRALAGAVVGNVQALGVSKMLLPKHSAMLQDLAQELDHALLLSIKECMEQAAAPAEGETVH